MARTEAEIIAQPQDVRGARPTTAEEQAQGVWWGSRIGRLARQAITGRPRVALVYREPLTHYIEPPVFDRVAAWQAVVDAFHTQIAQGGPHG
jgi:hypothetical protein